MRTGGTYVNRTKCRARVPIANPTMKMKDMSNGFMTFAVVLVAVAFASQNCHSFQPVAWRGRRLSNKVENRLLTSTPTTSTETSPITSTPSTSSLFSTLRPQQTPQQLGSFESIDDEYDEFDIEERVVTLHDMTGMPPWDYETGWLFQKDFIDLQFHRISVGGNQFGDYDAILMMQHEPVYTLGTAADDGYVLSKGEVPVVRMGRGGEVTYHGPGQLVVYPILDLHGYKLDMHWYLRALEESVILALKDLGIDHATRQDNVTGVWIDGKKVAAVGIKCRRWITHHGLAVNIDPECLPAFEGIVPCGLVGKEVTCLNQHLDEPTTVPEFAKTLAKAMERVFCIKTFVPLHLR